MNQEEKAQKIIDRFKAVGSGATKKIRWTQNGVTIEANLPHAHSSGKGFVVTVRAYDSRGEVPTDNPYQFFNPPIAIVVQEPVFDEEGNIVSDVVVDDSDPILAAKQIIYEAVIDRAKQLGWTDAYGG